MLARSTLARSPRARCLRRLAAPSTPTPAPTRSQLAKHALAASIPFVGFGFVDNSVMILAGDTIDLTFGLHFGFSTMASAALGNACSDLFGIQFGHFIEGIAARAGVLSSTSALSAAQLKSKTARNWKHGGKAIGLTIGCVLGMFPLLFIDSNRAERLKRAARIDSIFSSVVSAVGDALNAKRATVWLLLTDPHTNERYVWTKASKDLNDVRIPVSTGVVGRCARTGQVQNVSDPYNDKDFTRVIDEASGLKTESLLCAPIKLGRRVVGVLEVVDSISGEFSHNDEELLISMASHLSLPIAESMSETEIDDKLITTLKQCEHSHKTIVLRRDSRT